MAKPGAFPLLIAVTCCAIAVAPAASASPLLVMRVVMYAQPQSFLGSGRIKHLFAINMLN